MSIYLTDEHGKLHKVAGAGYGDIDNKLNKESTNPVQNKVIYNPVTFAESERQKSKNLFNVINAYSKTNGGVTLNVTDNKFSINGVATSGWSANIPITPIYCKKNVTYTISVNDISGVRPTSGNYSIRLGDDTGFTNAKLTLYTTNMDTYVTYTPTADVVLTTAYVVFNEKNLSFTNYLFNVQFEENKIATEYQPYNGQITHNGDAPVVFAEAERQKSKNLYDATRPEYTINGLTISADNSKFYIISGNTKAQAIYRLGSSPLKKGTYTLCVEDVNGTLATSMLMNLYIGDTTNRPVTQQARLAPDTRRNYMTFTLNEDYEALRLGFYISAGDVPLNNVVVNYQIVDGSVADYDFQPYAGGAIAHEKDIADVEHVETIYNGHSDDANLNWGYKWGIYGDAGFKKAINLSKYKKLIAFIGCDSGDSSSYNAEMMVELDLIVPTVAYSGTKRYEGVNTVLNPYCLATGSTTLELVSAKIIVNSDKTELQFHGYKKIGEQAVGTSGSARLHRIEGVY